MNTLELFAGSRSFSKEAYKSGFNVWTSDIVDLNNKIDYVTDVFYFDIKKLPFKDVHILWASVPCETFSIASCRHHYKNYLPTSKKATLHQKLVLHTIDLIFKIKPKYWFIENPRGLLRKFPFMNELLDWNKAKRETVTYCQYGDTRMKPTDIWTNCFNWFPKPICKNGDNCHESAPRGSKTGTQGLNGYYKRSFIPPDLINEILQSSTLLDTVYQLGQKKSC